MLDVLLANYAQAVLGGVMIFAVSQGLADLRAQTPDAARCNVPGGDKAELQEAELQEIFDACQLDYLFGGEFFGRPDCMDVISAREIEHVPIDNPATSC